MATDVERLVVSLDATIVKYERAMQRALGQTNTTAKRIEDRFAKTQVRVGQSFMNAGALIGKAFAGAAALRGAQLLIDSSTRVQNSLKVAGLEGESLSKVYDSLFASAQRNAAPIEALAQLYGRATLSQKDLKASSADLLRFTENVSVALRVNGASAEQSSGALLQLSQLLSSGTVRAEEFNSVQEGALPILQAVAAGLKEAGGSVSKLRALVIDGKLSSAAFFAAFEAGSGILTEKVAGAELTVSQAFIRLQNVLIDAAGKFNDSTESGQRFAGLLDLVGRKIEEIANSPSFDKLLSDFFEEGAKRFAGDARDIERIAGAIAAVKDAMTDLNAEANIAASRAGTAQEALEGFARANAGVFSSEVAAAFNDLISQLAAGRGNAETAKAAIMAMGTADPKFDRVIGNVSILVNTFIALRDAANDALLATNGAALPNTQPTFAGQEGRGAKRLPPPTGGQKSIEDYPVAGGAKGKKTPGQNFKDDLDEQARRTTQLREETAAQAALNPLVNDYGFALTKLHTQQQLENDATKAGLALTPDRKAAIAELALGYANATVEAAKLAEAQDNVKQSMQDWFDTGRSAARGFIDDLVEGKSAAEALGNVFNQLGSKLIDLGLSGLFGTGQGSSPFGLIGKALGFADGGYTGPGGRNQPAGVVHKGEVVWSQRDVARHGGAAAVDAMRRLPGFADGGVVGKMPALPKMPTISTAGAGAMSFPFAPVISMPGANPAAIDRMAVVLAKQQSEFEGRVKQIVRTQGRKWK
ncbi:tape measure domain-containing protein [Devosia sp. UYZn731]|uniref:tape measure protein n=1 Tax=Devosia sp. UYZn731 TaxID=3156345 RepID=UPI003397E368